MVYTRTESEIDKISKKLPDCCGHFTDVGGTR